jgi:hypothetical protein
MLLVSLLLSYRGQGRDGEISARVPRVMAFLGVSVPTSAPAMARFARRAPSAESVHRLELGRMQFLEIRLLIMVLCGQVT